MGIRAKRGLKLPLFLSSHRPPRAFYFSIIAILIGIPSGSLCRGESQWFKPMKRQISEDIAVSFSVLC